ncbi:MAG: AAA family ATPase [Polyangiaceae bacterium]|nr:AAA family ATPase [Polyangiaceae bacterium]
MLPMSTNSRSTAAADTPKVATGVVGLDDILVGGFPRNRMYLLQGDPGVGKTTMAIQFLLTGAAAGERCLYVTLSETREELHAVARSHGWSLDGLAVYEMYAGEALTAPEEEENTLYVPAEVELGERMRALLEEVDRVKPSRIVLDSCSELRLLAQSPLRFRRQLLALKADLVRRECTVLLLENPTSVGGDPLLQSLVHGVVSMEQLSPIYGAERRRLRVTKLREVAFRGGFHDMKIEKEGVVVFPRLVASEHKEPFAQTTFGSGVVELDALLGGGLDRGTSCLLVGPAGSGKSALATQYAVAAAQRGESSAFYAFDEGVGTLMARAAATGMDLAPHLQSGKIHVQQVDPAELSPGEFIASIRVQVEEHNARLVVIDSLNGYLQAMPEEQFLTAQLHEVLSYLRQQGVVTILVMAQHGLLGHMTTPIDVSYLADTVVLTRYFEAEGRVRKAISVAKKRSGRHEDTIREFGLNEHGLRVGEPLAEFHGVFTGVPTYDGQPQAATNLDGARD